MTKKEREIIGKQISAIIKKYRDDWQELKEQISSYGYQSDYPAQYEFSKPIKYLIDGLDEEKKQILIDEWKSKKDRMQFDSDLKYLEQYKAYIMEIIVSRASKATYWM
jgi:hypothetical protein